MKVQQHFWQKGETLIEALVALGLISIVVAAVATTITTSLSNIQYNENQTLATKYAQQGIESVRQIRNQNYSAFRNLDGLYCYGKDQPVLGFPQQICTTENLDTFIRSVEIDQSPGCANNVARVTVRVAFRDGKCQNNTYCHIQTHNTCLSTINPVKGL